MSRPLACGSHAPARRRSVARVPLITTGDLSRRTGDLLSRGSIRAAPFALSCGLAGVTRTTGICLSASTARCFCATATTGVHCCQRPSLSGVDGSVLVVQKHCTGKGHAVGEVTQQPLHIAHQCLEHARLQPGCLCRETPCQDGRSLDSMRHDAPGYTTECRPLHTSRSWSFRCGASSFFISVPADYQRLLIDGNVT